MKLHKSSRDRLVVGLYKSGAFFLKVFPSEFTDLLSVLGGTFAFVAAPKKRRVVADNQARVISNRLSKANCYWLAIKAYVSYARYWIEALSVGNLAKADLDAKVSFHGFENIYKALGEGKGVIVTSPHLGNWDLGAAWFASKGYPITAVMENLEPRELFDWFAENRVSFGVRAIPASSTVFGELSKALGRGEIVALVADRDLLSSGVEVDFFNERTLIPQGVALLALRTGAPIIPTAIYMLPDGFHLAMALDPIVAKREGDLRQDVKRITEEVVKRFETLITADPVQWHLFQPNWPSQSENFPK
jgi:KDO2-lipid IV(A) lauroyltransferase